MSRKLDWEKMRRLRVSVPAPSDMICLSAPAGPADEAPDKKECMSVSKPVVRVYVPGAAVIRHPVLFRKECPVSVVLTSVDDGKPSSRWTGPALHEILGKRVVQEPDVHGTQS